jgi:hypothetical protein
MLVWRIMIRRSIQGLQYTVKTARLVYHLNMEVTLFAIESVWYLSVKISHVLLGILGKKYNMRTME